MQEVESHRKVKSLNSDSLKFPAVHKSKRIKGENCVLSDYDL